MAGAAAILLLAVGLGAWLLGRPAGARDRPQGEYPPPPPLHGDPGALALHTCIVGERVGVKDADAGGLVVYGVAFSCPEPSYGCVRDDTGRAACGDVL